MYLMNSNSGVNANLTYLAHSLIYHLLAFLKLNSCLCVSLLCVDSSMCSF